jgi:hypothetical protein
MRSWLQRTEPDPRLFFIISGLLTAVGLWELFFVFFRSEDTLFAMSAAILLLVGVIGLWRAVSLWRRGRPSGTG